MNVCLPYDLRLADRITCYTSNWAEDANRSLMSDVHFQPQLRSADSVPTFFRSEQTKRTEVYACECSFPTSPSINWPSHNLSFKVTKRGKQKYEQLNMRLPCDHRSPGQVTTFPPKCAKEVNTIIISNLCFHVIYDPLTGSQRLLPGKQEKWTEAWLAMLVCYVDFD